VSGDVIGWRSGGRWGGFSGKASGCVGGLGFLSEEKKEEGAGLVGR
jgi:hypothetical protein